MIMIMMIENDNWKWLEMIGNDWKWLEMIGNDDNENDENDDWKIECINVTVRLVSRRGGSLNWTWLPPSSSRRK